MGSFLSRSNQNSGTMTDKPMNAHVRQVTDSIWTFSKPFLRVNLFKIGGRSTAVRFPNGDVFLVSPTEPDETTKETLDKIGKVKYLVAPDYEVDHPLLDRSLSVASLVPESIQGHVPGRSTYWNGGFTRAKERARTHF
jgi:hypothetical protein